MTIICFFKRFWCWHVFHEFSHTYKISEKSYSAVLYLPFKTYIPMIKKNHHWRLKAAIISKHCLSLYTEKLGMAILFEISILLSYTFYISDAGNSSAILKTLLKTTYQSQANWKTDDIHPSPSRSTSSILFQTHKVKHNVNMHAAFIKELEKLDDYTVNFTKVGPTLLFG